MNNNQIKAFIKSGKKSRKPIGDGLYIRTQSDRKAYWEVRYSLNGKRRFIRIEGGAYPQMTLADAKIQNALIKQQILNGIDPLAERVRATEETIKTVNDLFDDWYMDVEKRLKHPSIPKRIYTKEVQPLIGELTLDQVNPRDIRAILHRVAKSGRMAIANDTLMLCKQLFRHGVKLDLINFNPAEAFSTQDAGGVEKSRTRALTFQEIDTVFSIFRENHHTFTRENYLACALLVCLGVRKGELIAAQWSEFDFDKMIWKLPSNRSKTGTAITIPISPVLIDILNELKVLSCGSLYLFPSRRKSKRREYISDDTLNHALAKLFGQKVNTKGETFENVFKSREIEHFTIHDLRRTCRSLLSELKVPSHIAERCLNHKIKGVEGIYDRYDYLDERREALTRLANNLEFSITPQANVLSIHSATSV